MCQAVRQRVENKIFNMMKRCSDRCTEAKYRGTITGCWNYTSVWVWWLPQQEQPWGNHTTVTAKEKTRENGEKIRLLRIYLQFSLHFITKNNDKLILEMFNCSLLDDYYSLPV